MSLSIPLSADLPHLFFCLAHCKDEDRSLILTYLVALLQDDLFQDETSPGRFYAWISHIQVAIKNKQLEIYELGIDIEQLTIAYKQAHTSKLHTEIDEVLAKNSSGSMGKTDAAILHEIAGEVEFHQIPETKLGFSKSSLRELSHGIIHGKFQRAARA